MTCPLEDLANRSQLSDLEVSLDSFLPPHRDANDLFALLPNSPPSMQPPGRLLPIPLPLPQAHYSGGHGCFVNSCGAQGGFGARIPCDSGFQLVPSSSAAAMSHLVSYLTRALMVGPETRQLYAKSVMKHPKIDQHRRKH